MLATPGDLPVGPEWVYEVEWDGLRVLAEVIDGGLHLVTPDGHDVTPCFPELAALTHLVPDVVLDGTIVMLTRGVPDADTDDPLLAERGRRVEAAGASRFAEVWLPAAAVSLQQALGRLVRSETDRGVMAVLDRRLADAGYRASLLGSLPPARLTRSLEDVRAFFAV